MQHQIIIIQIPDGIQPIIDGMIQAAHGMSQAAPAAFLFVVIGLLILLMRWKPRN
jgi:hypothetical protein